MPSSVPSGREPPDGFPTAIPTGSLPVRQRYRHVSGRAGSGTKEAHISGLELAGATIERSGLRVVSDLDLHLEPGAILWIDGASGAGKSTLLRALARLLPLAEGDLLLDGRPARDIAPHRWRAMVTLLPHPPLTLGPTVHEDLLAPHRLRERRHRPSPDRRQLERELEAVGLGDLGLDRPSGRLSQGQLARVAFVRTVSTGPRVLLLDEPTANLDPDSVARLAARVHAYADEGGMAVVAAHATPWDGATRHLRLHDGRATELTR